MGRIVYTMQAIVNSVFVRDPAEIVEFPQDKAEAPVLDGYRFRLQRNVQANITMSLDPSDGSYYSLVIGAFIDGVESGYVTDWIRNGDPVRSRDYVFDVARYIKFTNPKKVHTVEIKLGKKKLGQMFRPRDYDLFDSEVYYYRVGPAPVE